MTFNYSEINKIFIRSLRLTAKWGLWKWLFFSSIGAFSASLLFANKFFGFSYYHSILFTVVGSAILFLARFFAIFIKEGLKYYHEVYLNSVYGDAIILLKDSFAYTHYYRKTPGHRDTEFVKSMMLICNNLQTIFSNILKEDCSVSIKVPFSKDKVDEQSTFMNLTRDIAHNSRDTDMYKQQIHSLIGNTAFSNAFNKVLINAKHKQYINNSVNSTVNYDNTSRECYTDGILPYNSELVYPITPLINDNKHNLDCHGFICVDTKKLNAFTGKYDAAILEGVADGIYDIISQRNQYKNLNQ